MMNLEGFKGFWDELKKEEKEIEEIRKETYERIRKEKEQA